MRPAQTRPSSPSNRTPIGSHPIAPLLFDADEVAAGEIAHAIRFNLPSSRIRLRTHVAPASHSASSTGPSSTPPYGARLRLRADYPLASLPNEGGNIAFTARSDRATTAKWSGLLGDNDLAGIAIADFEMVETGERFPNLNFEHDSRVRRAARTRRGVPAQGRRSAVMDSARAGLCALLAAQVSVRSYSPAQNRRMIGTRLLVRLRRRVRSRRPGTGAARRTAPAILAFRSTRRVRAPHRVVRAHARDLRSGRAALPSMPRRNR